MSSSIPYAKKICYYVLADLPTDETERFLWQYILQTNVDVINKEFEKLHLSFIVIKHENDEQRKYLVKDESQASSGRKEEICQLLHRFENGLKAIKTSCNPSYVDRFRAEKDVKIYKYETGNIVWVVGKEEAVRKVVQEIAEMRDGAEADVDLKTWENISLVKIPLTQEEQAKIILYKLWDRSVLSEVTVERDMKQFSVKVCVPSFAEKTKVEDLLKKEMQSCPVFLKKLSFNSDIINFISTDSVFQYIDKKLNYGRDTVFYPWYIDCSEKIVTIYSKLGAVSSTFEQVSKAVISNQLKVPAKYFATSEVQHYLSDLKNKYQQKVDFWFSGSCATLNILSTYDVAHRFEEDIKKLCGKERFSVSKEKRNAVQQVLQPCRLELENKYQVEIIDIPENMQYGWIIQGEPKSVQACYDELKSFVNSVISRNKTFYTDIKLQDMESEISSLNSPSCQIIMDDKPDSKTSKVTDLREDFICHRWILPNGNNIKIVNADHRYLDSSCLLLEVEEATENFAGKNTEIDWKRKTVRLFLPRKNGSGSGNEKKLLQVKFDDLFQKHKSSTHLVFYILGALKLGWPPKLILTELLSALDRHEVVMPFAILELTKSKFVAMSGIIQDYLDLIYKQTRSRIFVKTGELATEKVDAIVNSTSSNLNLKQGVISALLSSRAGDEMQKECDEIMQTRNYKLLSATDVVKTKGYRLPCGWVLHGAMGAWNVQTFEHFIHNCLKEAEFSGCKSIAFPAIGTGRLNYPVNEVAKIMLQTAQNRLSKAKSTLENVTFVLYQNDTNSLQAFKKEEEMLYQAFKKTDLHETSQEPCIIRVTVTGEKKTVDQKLLQIEDMIRAKHQQLKENPEEPDEQNISRDVSPIVEGATGFTDHSPSPMAGQNEFYAEIPPDRQANVQQSLSESDSSKDNDNGCSIRIELTNSNDKGTYKEFAELLKKYGIDEKRIIWCFLQPNEAKIKFLRASDAKKLLTNFREGNIYNIISCDVEAVVNIRARVNRSINSYLENVTCQQALEKQSGVQISNDEDGTFVLSGELSEICVARNILMHKIENELEHKEDYFSKEPKQTAEKKKQSSRNSKSTEENEERNVSLQGNGNLKIIIKQNPQNVNNVNSEREDKKEIESPKFSTEDKTPNRTESNLDWKMNENKSKEFGASNQNAGAISFDKSDDDDDEDDDDEEFKHSSKESENISNLPTFPDVTEEYLVMPTKEGINVFVYQGNLCYLRVDSIVNSTNSKMNPTTGLAGVIMEAGGEALVKDCDRYIKRNNLLKQGNVCVTTAGDLKHYHYIFHVCSPVWGDRKSNESYMKCLSAIVENVLIAANEKLMTSVAIPAIGAGLRGGPSEMCFPSYLEGILMFSHKYGEKSTLREIHFVDRDPKCVALLDTVFLMELQKKDSSNSSSYSRITKKLSKISGKIKEKIVSYAEKLTSDKKPIIQPLSQNVTIVICDGALFTCYRHKHAKESLDTDYKLTERGIVITEHKHFTRGSPSTAHFLQKSKYEFHRRYEAIGKLRKNICDVFEIPADDSLQFGKVFCAILPPLTPNVKKKNSEAQVKFFGYMGKCHDKILLTAHKSKIRHLCMPVLAEDMYDLDETWFLETCIFIMLERINKFVEQRKSKSEMLIHITTRQNETLERIMKANFQGQRQMPSGQKDAKPRSSFGTRV